MLKKIAPVTVNLDIPASEQTDEVWTDVTNMYFKAFGSVRAEGYGDDYVVWTETDTGFDADPTAVCYPSVAYDDASVDGTVVVGSGFCNEFERMNAKSSTHASEANLEANPAGSKLYGVWTQTIVEVIDELNKIEETVDSEASVRRVWWIDNYRSSDPADTWILQGTNQSQ